MRFFFRRCFDESFITPRMECNPNPFYTTFIRISLRIFFFALMCMLHFLTSLIILSSVAISQPNESATYVTQKPRKTT